MVLVAGFAAADALRSRAQGSESPPVAETVQTGPTRRPGPQPQPDAPPGWPIGALEGSLVFTDANDCRIRTIGLAGGRERPLARFEGTCELWSAPVGQRLAYSLGPSSGDGFVPFRLADLSRPRVDLGGYRALFGVVLWSQDGQRVAWCGRRRVGFDLEIGGAARRLPSCPADYTTDGRIAYAIGDTLRVEEEVVLRVRGGITYVHYGTDGSVTLLVDGERLERWEADTLTSRTPIPASLQGRTPVLSPDNCGAAFPPVNGLGTIELLSLGCLPEVGRRSFVGTDAAWSPDGKWLAVAEQNSIAFARLVGPQADIRWPAAAAQLAWRPR